MTEGEVEKIKEEYSKAWGISALVVGILSIPLVFMPYFGFPLAILGLIGVGKQRKIGSSGFEIAALILNIIGLVLNLIMLGILGLALFIGLA